MYAHTAASCVAVAEAVADGGFCIAKASRTLTLLYEPGYAILGMVSMRRYFGANNRPRLPLPFQILHSYHAMRPLTQEAQFSRTKSIG
ncbi:uncharacterized protein TrAtP1_003556 [Trichoderma atroviride]|uniref:uncharacterized protein n=1 Tax=Hypocrea atroviridis TaxID=63577 RepID=UPI0033189152|nr:hypothetical protein TrAtP1_003556 [Trichoderma atroviride]